MKRFVVTGASGFLGSALTTSLTREGHAVLAVVRKASDLRRLAEVHSQIKLAWASLNEIASIENQICDFAPDVVFHLAWSGGDSKKFVNNPDQMSNIPGSLELVNIAGRAQAKTFICFGSAVEYGKYRIPVSEDDQAEPTNLYGAAKLATLQSTEALCGMWKMRFCGVRPFWVYGPQDSGLRMIPSLIEQLLDSKRPALTLGEQLWDYLYIDDATSALIQLAERTNAEGIFNLASGTAVQLKTLIERIRDRIDPSLELGFGDFPYAADQIMHLQANIDRLKLATGWEPQVSLEEGLEKTIAWHRAQRSSAAKQMA